MDLHKVTQKTKWVTKNSGIKSTEEEKGSELVSIDSNVAYDVSKPIYKVVQEPIKTERIEQEVKMKFQKSIRIDDEVQIEEITNDTINKALKA